MNTYNGYKNYETWNVLLWLNNDENLYNSMLHFLVTYVGVDPYYHLICSLGFQNEKTHDDVSWLSDLINEEELNNELFELMGELQEAEENEFLDF